MTIPILEERAHPAPTLPQKVSKQDQESRAFALSLKRTAYNYMRSYLPPLAFSADLPDGEAFSLPYEGLVLGPLLDIAANFEAVVVAKLEQEFKDDLYPPGGFQIVKELRESFDRMKEQLHGVSAINVAKDISTIVDFAEKVMGLPEQLESFAKHLSEVPEDVERIITTVKQVAEDYKEQGVTAFLKDTLFGVLRGSGTVGEEYLHPSSLKEYEELYPKLPIPRNLTYEHQDWMPEGAVWQQDWYFGWLQVAGFNTTQFRGVGEGAETVPLATLTAKMPIDDALFQRVAGVSETLAEASAGGRLFAVDYTQFEGIGTSELHGHTRNLCAPIALFYWKDDPGPGYPPGRGALVPIAIQLYQQHNKDKAPIFTPASCPSAREFTGVEDDNGMKWQMAKWHVSHACAVQHETVAHLGDCHLVIEPIVVAMNRQLPESHPIHALLKPHFRFTIAINHSALHSLVIPGGVVSSVLSPTIQDSMGLVRQAYLERRFDHRNPKYTFARRGVDKLPEFPLRDDTTLLYDAIETWVREYLGVYYAGDADVQGDYELQAFANELASQEAAGVIGLEGLEKHEGTYHFQQFDYLVQVIAQIIYIGSAQHASVNFAQYPMMSYLPSVSGTAYALPPVRAGEATEADYLAMLPPIDVALYQLSFGYLLSAVQYDSLGHFSNNPRRDYFQDLRVEPALSHFRQKLAQAEATIREKNVTRPLPYETQLPSLVPNSISI